MFGPEIPEAVSSDSNVAAAMEKPINSWGLMTQVAAAVASHLTAQFVREGEAALDRYMPAVSDLIHAGMGANEVTAHIMTILMRAFPGSTEGSTVH